MADKPVVVYGASGFSGRLIVEFLREYNVPFVAAGRDRARLEEVLDHVPGISTADYDIVEVGHDVGELTKLFKGAKVVCNTVGPCIYYGDTVIEACLASGCHYIDTGGETPWVRRVRETLAREVQAGGAARRAGDRVHVRDRRGRDPRRAGARAGHRHGRGALDVHGHADVRLDPDDLRPAAVGVDLPPAERVRRVAAGDDDRGADPGRVPDAARAPVGRLPASGLVQGRPADHERVRLRRPARPHADGGRRRRPARLPGEDPAAAAEQQKEILAGIADSIQAGTPPRENRRHQRTIDVVSARGSLDSIQIVVHGQGAYLQTGLIQAFAAHHLVFQPPHATGFASPCSAFGHRELLAALEAYGFARLKVVG